MVVRLFRLAHTSRRSALFLDNDAAPRLNFSEWAARWAQNHPAMAIFGATFGGVTVPLYNGATALQPFDTTIYAGLLLGVAGASSQQPPFPTHPRLTLPLPAIDALWEEKIRRAVYLVKEAVALLHSALARCVHRDYTRPPEM